MRVASGILEAISCSYMYPAMNIGIKERLEHRILYRGNWQETTKWEVSVIISAVPCECKYIMMYLFIYLEVNIYSCILSFWLFTWRKSISSATSRAPDIICYLTCSRYHLLPLVLQISSAASCVTILHAQYRHLKSQLGDQLSRKGLS